MDRWASKWFGRMRVRILAVVIVLLLASSVGSVLLVRAALLDQLEDEVAASLARESEEFRLLSAGNDPRTGEPFDGDLRAIFDVYFSREVADEGESLLAFVDGRLYESRRAQGAADADELGSASRYWLALETQEAGAIETPRGQARYVALPLEGATGDGLFVVANFPALEREEIQNALRTQIIITLLTLLVATVVGTLLAGRVLRPLVTLAETARRISDTDLSQRIPLYGRDEASLIAEQFNEMLTRLENVFRAQRQFLDDTSHELRTPLTIIRGHLELLELDETPEARRETTELVLDEVDRLTRMVDDLFVLAQSHQPGFVVRERLEVGDLMRELDRKLVTLAPVAVKNAVAEDVSVLADRQRLTQAVMQLVSNAVVHAGKDARVLLDATLTDGNVVLAVTDDGAGVDPDDVDLIFDRSHQGGADPSRGGAGLGLAIAKAIAEAHSGSVRLAPTAGRGARFEIVLPVGPAG